MDKIQKELELIGISRHEAAVYVAILEGARNPSQIIAKVDFHRPSVYKALGSLLHRGLISVQKHNKRNVYFINDPHIIKVVAEDLLEVAESVSGEVAKKMADKNKRISPPQFIQGRHAITTVFADVLKTMKRGGTFYRITSEKNLDYINSRLPRGYRKHRDDKNLQRLVISNNDSGKKKRNRLERFIRFFPDDLAPFDQNIIMLIYGNKAAFIDASSDTAIIIDNFELSQFLSKIFLALYKKL